MGKKDHRFILKFRQSTFGEELRIMVDRETGVNYLFYSVGTGGGLAPLLDKEGKPVISDVYGENER
ncbi:DUF6440 family protein [Zongyangia hominis]|uniref:DUF6440 domain-containing protein n=1 Tax=Zongyangia hominis TaxID=2763677 RepID=A0A926IBK5_9FIRM|nr:DUF6440 family protein [Zongyangia hominis]MBC8571336.1 hypothetical protein [Zongyangia hominis]